MIYVTYDEAGNLTGCYTQDLHPEHAAHFLEVTPELAENWPRYRMNAARTGVELAPKPPAPPPTVPQRVPMLNAVLVLIDADWWEPLNAHIETLPAKERLIARAYLDRAQTMARDNALVLSIPAVLGKTEAEVDELFILAGALNA